MSIGDYLTTEELKHVTGRRQKASMVRHLNERRVPFYVAADGWPRVRTDDLLGDAVVSLSARRSKEPKFDAFSPS